MIRHKLKIFLKFFVLSGLGWLCDFSTFSILVKIFDVTPFMANVFSSYTGVTFVWFTSLHRVFNVTGSFNFQFLVIFWVYQLFSILIYSWALSFFVFILENQIVTEQPNDQFALLGKIIVTPFNLFTNFIFMKFISKFMIMRTKI